MKKLLSCLAAGALLASAGSGVAAQQARDCKPGVSASPRSVSPPSVLLEGKIDCDNTEYELDLVGLVDKKRFTDRDMVRGKYFIFDDPDIYVALSLRENGEDVRDQFQYRERVGVGLRIPMPSFIDDVVEDVSFGTNYEVHGVHRGEASLDAGVDVNEDYFLDPVKRFFGFD